MCICINCLYVHKCSTYKNIQKQHGQPYYATDTLFYPKNPIINVNLHNNLTAVEIDWDITECLSFIDKPGNWMLK